MLMLTDIAGSWAIFQALYICVISPLTILQNRHHHDLLFMEGNLEKQSSLSVSQSWEELGLELKKQQLPASQSVL